MMTAFIKRVWQVSACFFPRRAYVMEPRRPSACSGLNCCDQRVYSLSCDSRTKLLAHYAIILAIVACQKLVYLDGSQQKACRRWPRLIFAVVARAQLFLDSSNPCLRSFVAKLRDAKRCARPTGGTFARTGADKCQIRR